MEIKEGALVKAWDDDPSKYSLGVYNRSYEGQHVISVLYSDWPVCRDHAIEIPQELAKQLEDLSYE